ncbi:MAG: Gfo/Idh/MocA family oxidoreductase [Fidelibacterota bacterium]|nr:MAG: Gfo/Idh/MocA family oxidoreductase [Candidatus Neomarinimicrobiota bacterium]
MEEKPKTATTGNSQKHITRSRFITKAGTAALSFMIIKPGLVRGTKANSKITLGVIGCGGRGTWIANLFNEHGGYQITAAADYFQDRVDVFGEKYQVAQSRRFINLSCYQKLLEQKPDAVAIISPPYFHPEQAAAAVDAGCHVYIAKPVAVDVPGCHSIAQSGREASAKKRCFLVDFQTRTNALFREAIRRVHDGAIGEIAFGQSSYHADRLAVKASPDGTRETNLRNWVFDKTLSGDIITEQNIHSLDVASWIMNQPPVYAVGTGGRKVRTDVGDCWDHFALLFQYPGHVGITFSSRQFNGHDTVGGIKNRVFGSLGVLETEYGGEVLIRGKNFYRGGRTNEIYRNGAVSNIATFYDSITKKRFDNATVAPSVRSNLVTILGRTAAYEGRIVYWDELIESEARLEVDLKGLKA